MSNDRLFEMGPLPEPPNLTPEASPDFAKVRAEMERQIWDSLAMPATYVFGDANQSNYSSGAMNIEMFAKQMDELQREFTERLKPMAVFTSIFLTERRQYRFPRSKKKRIRAKWAKDQRNFRDAPLRGYWLLNGDLYVHPKYFETFKKLLCQKMQSHDGKASLEWLAFNPAHRGPIFSIEANIQLPKDDAKYLPVYYDPMTRYFREVKR